MDKYIKSNDQSIISNSLILYKKHFIKANCNKYNENKNSKNKNFLLYHFIKEIKRPYLLAWGVITYNMTNILGVLKYFHIVKEKSISLGETLENIVKTDSFKSLTFRNFFDFVTKSFYSINSLIFSPKIMLSRTFIYLTGVFNFHINERATINDYIFLLSSSFFLAVPFYYQLDNIIIKRLKFTRLEQSNLYLKNICQHKLLSSSIYAFIDNFLLNLIFFGCIDLLENFNYNRGFELTYEKIKLDELKKIADENETLERVLMLNNNFYKKNYSSDKVTEYFFAGFVASIIYSPIEALYFILRKNLYNIDLLKKNLNNLNEEGKSINAVLFKRNLKMNLFRIFICNSLNSLLLLRSVERY